LQLCARVTHRRDRHTPPFCPNPRCASHTSATGRWSYVRFGSYFRKARPHRVRRFRCEDCGHTFGEQSFRLSYWFKRPELTATIFQRLNSCSGFRQIASELHCSPQTVALHAARLARHCMLFHEQLRPKGPLAEPVVLDSFVSFEWSQYHPTAFHTLVGKTSHFFYGFTDSELRRSGGMTKRQKDKRARLEREFGRPDPRSVEKEVAHLLAIVAPVPQALELHTDEHEDYPRAIQGLPHLRITHRTTLSRAARTPRNRLFAINLLHLLIRHGGANHKRETIAFSKRRQSAAERLWIFLVWRDYLKSFSERKHDATPAMRAGLCEKRLSLRRVLTQRLLPSRIRLPDRWQDYYWRRTPTRCIAHPSRHTLKLAT
jgi:transposase-like protein